MDCGAVGPLCGLGAASRTCPSSRAICTAHGPPCALLFKNTMALVAATRSPTYVRHLTDLCSRFGALSSARIRWIELLMSISLKRRREGSATAIEQTANRLALFPTLTQGLQTARRDRPDCRRVATESANQWCALCSKLGSKPTKIIRGAKKRERAGVTSSENCVLPTLRAEAQLPLAYERTTRQRLVRIGGISPRAGTCQLGHEQFLMQ